MFSFIENIFVVPIEYEVITKKERKLERAKMYDLQEKSSKRICIVAGELDAKFYNEDFVRIIRKKLETIPDYQVEMLFSKDERLNFDDKILKIFKENRQLCELIKDGAFNDRLSLYVSKKRPENHFGIVDSSILIEKVHKQGDNRDVLLVHNYIELVEKYKRYFNKLIVSSEDNYVVKLTYDHFKNCVA